MRPRVLVAMSGGVDSSVAAALVAESGAEAVGVTMKLLGREGVGFGCCGSPADVQDAKRVCEKLGISHYTVDMAELFNDAVIKPFIDAYAAGRTPNPCVECNRKVKFGHLLGLAQAWGCDTVATGHYARVEGGRLLRSRDEAKDQTYFLYALTARELGKVSFPVGGLSKDEVRAKARELGLKTADKPESMETCFVPGRDVKGFLAAHGVAPQPGRVVNAAGETLGEHAGYAGLTVGQRKGLGVTTKAPVFVTRIEPETNTVVVGGKDETFSKGLTATGVTWTGAAPGAPTRIHARIRHRHAPAAALLTVAGETASLSFEAPQASVTPGQAVVFYAGDEVLGGGTIVRGEPS
ncbi:MAG: tRNA 2-thiouridine(34) synthase MnmA [Elusimicrobiota bacterium]|nr:tRNA 2-thiouridine(34) synthase MnmA [Elusimicrobiota bacterium]